MLKEILEKSESKVIDEAFIKEITEYTEKSINEKADLKATELLKEKEEEYQKTLDEMVKTVSETIKEEQLKKFNEAVEAKVLKETTEYTAMVKEEAEAGLAQSIQEMENENKSYLEYAVNQFIKESSPTWKEEVKVQKAEKLMEDFQDLAEAFGLKVESLDEDSKLSLANAENNKLLKEKEELELVISKQEKEKALDEAVKGLDSVKADRLTSLVEKNIAEDSSVANFKSQLELFKSALGDANIVEKKTVKDNKEFVPSWER